MVNNEKSVPIQKIDLISNFGTMLKIGGVSYTVLAASDVLGTFSLAEGGTVLASQPVVSLDFGEGVTAAVVYFVADYAYAGFTANGAAITATGTVDADSANLYKATLADGAVTIEAVTPVLG